MLENSPVEVWIRANSRSRLDTLLLDFVAGGHGRLLQACTLLFPAVSSAAGAPTCRVRNRRRISLAMSSSSFLMPLGSCTLEIRYEPLILPSSLAPQLQHAPLSLGYGTRPTSPQARDPPLKLFSPKARQAPQTRCLAGRHSSWPPCADLIHSQTPKAPFPSCDS